MTANITQKLAPIILTLVSALVVPSVLFVSCSKPSLPIRERAQSIETNAATDVDNERYIARGKRLASQHGCTGCHSTDGRTQVGPTWKSLYGQIVSLAASESILADDHYIRESILDPNAKIVEGFLPNVMPNYEMSNDEVDALVSYIKSLE